MLYTELLLIPKNKVVTYKSLAQKYNIHPRAVARMLASNTQQDIYPCYKVVCYDGSIGGYNLGIQEKIRRLHKDNITMINHKVANDCIRNPIDTHRQNTITHRHV